MFEFDKLALKSFKSLEFVKCQFIFVGNNDASKHVNISSKHINIASVNVVTCKYRIVKTWSHELHNESARGSHHTGADRLAASP